MFMCLVIWQKECSCTCEGQKTLCSWVSKGLCVPPLLCLGIQPILFLGSFASPWSKRAPRCFLPASPICPGIKIAAPCFHWQLAPSVTSLGLFPWHLCFCCPTAYIPYTSSFTFSVSIFPYPSRPFLIAHTHICAGMRAHTHTHTILKGNLHTCRILGLLVQDNGLW